jgi:hypothetical protein
MAVHHPFGLACELVLDRAALAAAVVVIGFLLAAGALAAALPGAALAVAALATATLAFADIGIPGFKRGFKRGHEWSLP